jgi:hypothetical protein
VSNGLLQAISEKLTELSQKRNEGTEESPSKRRRKVDAESTPEVPQKRKITDRDESPSKRPRRENKRVKDFPAGNVTTSGSRIAFLKTLCKIPKFLSMVDLVLAVASLILFKTFLYI